MFRKLLTMMAVVGFVLILLPTVASAQGYACFPTCSTVDGRMLAFESAGLSTFNSNQLTFVIGAPATSTELEFGLFDGDADTANWDFGSSTFVYELFADPTGDGTGATLLQTWTDADFGNNVWTDQIMAHDPGAQSESGNYFYRLLVTYTSLGASDIGTFKIRTPDTYQIRIDPQAFSFIGMVTGDGDLLTIYPELFGPPFPKLTPTTYDGSWTFFTDIEASATTLEFWDGDMDFGQADCNPMFQDTDDPDTLGSDPTNPTPVFLPPWAALATTHEEGIALGRAKTSVVFGSCTTTGDPTDDITDFVFYQRSPSVIYTITTPDGTVLTNTNPSGNQEWETFTLTTAAIGGDFNNLSLPPGRYRIDMIGMDLNNFNAWFLPSAVNAICEDGDDCTPRLKPYLVGDTVFYDSNHNGIQDGGELGIAGVLVNLRGPFGAIKDTTTTDVDGKYEFGVFPNTYTVEVEPSNFGPGGPLENLASTTGGDSITHTVVDANVLTYDFGYAVCGTCDGKVSALTLLYLGDAAAQIQVVQKKDGAVVYDGFVAPGESFSFSGQDKKGTLSTEIWIYADGVEVQRIHTSCSQPIGPGLVFGDFLVLAGASRNGGPLCATNGGGGGGGGGDPDCGECDGKVSALTLQYLGSSGAFIEVVQKKDGAVVFYDFVAPGESFSFSGQDKKGTLGTEIWIYADGVEVQRIHTSCSQPIGVGLTFGDFLVLAGASRNGGPFCSEDDDGGGGGVS